MKCLSLIQPWATLIAIGEKSIETRSWFTPYRGPLAIHASAAMTPDSRDFASGCPAVYRALHRAGYTTRTQMNRYKLLFEDQKWLPAGAVIATCELVDCIEIQPKRRWINYADRLIIPPDEPELTFGDYTPGRFAWILRNVQALPEPVPARGMLGLWEWEGFKP